MITTPGPELRHGGADGEFCMVRQTAHRPVGQVRLVQPSEEVKCETCLTFSSPSDLSGFSVKVQKRRREPCYRESLTARQDVLEWLGLGIVCCFLSLVKKTNG